MEQGQETSCMLLVFDFDHTLIDANADLSLTKLSPGGYIPDKIQSLYSDRGWIKYMSAVFRHLHEHGTSPEKIQKHVEKLPLAPGMAELFEHIRDVCHYHTIIISDSNSVLIDYVLKYRKLESLISHVFTNPAQYDAEGCLQVRNYHVQDWCSLSTINLCKGYILQEYVKSCSAEGTFYSNIVYVGDGSNDLCPGLTLSDRDYLCPRKGFSLWNKLEEQKTKKSPEMTVKASVFGWESGVEIRTFLENVVHNQAK